ncbi:MAG: hypothetical protein PCFJNLEI_00721 [Verrucomicrobiae bacterium]|nr:hypothetical protein [Verrucomicrobiae bacterium]
MKQVYNALPIWAQTLAVNFASRQNFRLKYGGVFRGWLVDLEHNEKKSRDELLHQQQVAIRYLLEYAVEHVPAYKGRSPEKLSEWPILEKREITGAHLSDEFQPRDLMELHTSGTTGTPLTVKFSKEYHQVEMAFRWRHKAWAGVPFLSSSAYVSGHPVVPPMQTKPPFWRWDRYEKRLLCSSYHIDPPAYAAAFQKYRPDFIHGYPSSLCQLGLPAEALAKTGGYKPKAVFTASETLLDHQRAAIEAGFGAKVFNWYGNTEMTCNIVECAAGNLHYRTDYGFLELLDDGTMIVTGLNNRAMPLIRYRIGDRATAKAGACSCGVAFPLIERIEGRVEDYVRTPSGRLIGRLDHLFKDARYVKEAQIVQRQLDEIIIRVVKTGPFDEAPVRAEARQRLGDMRVTFEYVDRIERTAAGKFRFVISEWR